MKQNGISATSAIKVIKEHYSNRLGRTVTDSEAKAILKALETSFNNGELKIS